MKLLITLFSFLISLSNTAQDLKNTEWIKIKAERKDGSKIVDRHGPDTLSTKFFFTEDSAYVAVFQQYSFKQKYNVHDGILSIGELANYQIDSLNDAFLYISQLSNKGLPDDKLNSYVFINSDYLFDYLKKENHLNITDDSVVVCDNWFSPTFGGDISRLFFKEFPSVNSDKSIAGSFIITYDGNIQKVHLDTANKFSNKERDKVMKAIYATRGSWVLPPTPMQLQFKINFYLSFIHLESLYTSAFDFFEKHGSKNLKTQQLAEADKHFNNGLRFFNKKKYENSIDEFKQCIAIDSTNTDAYYDLAYSYQQSGNKELACETWRKLDEMGQKGGEKFYNANCR